MKKEWGKQEDFDIGTYRSVLEIPENLLNEGLYSLIIDIFLPPALPDSSYQVRVHNIINFEIIDELENQGARGSYPGDWQPGGGIGYLIRPSLNFKTKYIGK